MLSSAMTTPVTVLSSPKVPVSILGTRPSKTCQNEIIPMNGSEAIAVRFQSKGIFRRVVLSSAMVVSYLPAPAPSSPSARTNAT